jgi:hypothetical protein
MRTQYIPRWLYEEFQLDDAATQKLPPTSFANTEVWPMRLKWLSVCGRTTLNTLFPWHLEDGGITRRIELEVGITGYSDVNIVPIGGHGLMAAERQLQKDMNSVTPDATAGNIEIARPVTVPRDGGLVVMVQNTGLRHLHGQEDDTFQAVMPSIVFHGYHQQSRIPGFLAGRLNKTLTIGQQDTIDAADLLNNGREDFIITQISADAGDCLYPSGEIPHYFYDLMSLAWKINPSSGVQWMPRERPIPIGCLAPFSRMLDLFDIGPKAYVFPDNVILMPRQRLGIQVTELSDMTQSLHICLFGELEVK